MIPKLMVGGKENPCSKMAWCGRNCGSSSVGAAFRHLSERTEGSCLGFMFFKGGLSCVSRCYAIYYVIFIICSTSWSALGTIIKEKRNFFSRYNVMLPCWYAMVCIYVYVCTCVCIYMNLFIDLNDHFLKLGFLFILHHHIFCLCTYWDCCIFLIGLDFKCI